MRQPILVKIYHEHKHEDSCKRLWFRTDRSITCSEFEHFLWNQAIEINLSFGVKLTNKPPLSNLPFPISNAILSQSSET